MISKLLAAALLSLSAVPAALPNGAPNPPSSAPIRVMIVGVFHMSNPGHDLHNLKVDDVLAPRRQAEIRRVTEALTNFRPTKIGVEWPADVVADRYKQYRAGTLAPSRNEVVQLGFRLAKASGAEGVYSLDADGDFPYERVKSFADSHAMVSILDAENTVVQKDIDAQDQILAGQSIGAELRLLNDPAKVDGSNRFYRSLLRIGAGGDQPGADLVASWYHRNLLICANLLQLARPGDRIVVFFGAGHAFQLRQCVRETPGYILVEPNAYLPR